jgi:hypothetical protein
MDDAKFGSNTISRDRKEGATCVASLQPKGACVGGDDRKKEQEPCLVDTGKVFLLAAYLGEQTSLVSLLS